MFTIGETRPNCDANEQKEDAQGTRQIRRGRLNNETQHEQRRRSRHQDTTEQGQKTTSLRLNCPPSPSFARFCESRIYSFIRNTLINKFMHYVRAFGSCEDLRLTEKRLLQRVK